jgi:hypothetical protein
MKSRTDRNDRKFLCRMACSKAHPAFIFRRSASQSPFRTENRESARFSRLTGAE